MLLRDERQMALNRIEGLLFLAEEQYEHAVARASDAALRAFFSARAREHRDRAAGLALHIRRADDLPAHPDPDREMVEELISGIKALLSGDANQALLEERIAQEEALAQAIGDALAQDLPADTQDYLGKLLDETAAAREKLVAMRR